MFDYVMNAQDRRGGGERMFLYSSISLSLFISIVSHLKRHRSLLRSAIEE